MAFLEGTRSSAEFMVVSILPDVCKSPVAPVPYPIVAYFNTAINYSRNVHFRSQFAFHEKSRLTTVVGDEAGVGGGVVSGVNKGFCRPVPGTHSTTVRVNGSCVDRHLGTLMFMNCMGPEGPANTIGIVIFLGNMHPGPVAPGGNIPQSLLSKLTGWLKSLGIDDPADLVKAGQTLYKISQTDWSNPASVLGAIGGLAGFAGLQDVAKAAEFGQKGYQVATADWSDPRAALGAIAGAANLAGLSNIAKAVETANKIRDVIKTDWSNPAEAFKAATSIARMTGLNEMAAQMASNAVLDDNIPVSQTGNSPFIFPKGSGGSGDAAKPFQFDPSKPNQTAITPDALRQMQTDNPVAYDRYMLLSDSQRQGAFMEVTPRDGDDKYSTDAQRTMFYIPGDGFSSSPKEISDAPLLFNVPDGIKEIFVAGKGQLSVGEFFGIKEKAGNWYFFGGLLDLGSPEMPGAGTSGSWWVPDRFLNADMSPYYDYHDLKYYGGDVRLSNLGDILAHELNAFEQGATTSPLQLPLQLLYSAATASVGVGTAACHSLADFYNDVFGSETPNTSPAAPAPAASNGGLASPPATGTPPVMPPTAPVPAGAVAGGGVDGILITTGGAPSAPAGGVFIGIVGGMPAFRMPDGTIKVGNGIVIGGDPAFQNKVMGDLTKIGSTRTGQRLLESMDSSGKTTTIQPLDPGTSGNSTEFYNSGLYKSDGTPGNGSNATIKYDPDTITIGPDAWGTRPPAIGLAHEMIHADQAMHGTTNEGDTNNDSKPDPTNPSRTQKVDLSEVETAGIPPNDNRDINENKIRSEWNPPQPQRGWY